MPPQPPRASAVDDCNKKEPELSTVNPVFFASSSRKTRIRPEDLLKNPQAAFIFAEILRPLDL